MGQNGGFIVPLGWRLRSGEHVYFDVIWSCMSFFLYPPWYHSCNAKIKMCNVFKITFHFERPPFGAKKLIYPFSPFYTPVQNSTALCTLLHYLEKYSCNPVQTWCVHLLGECSELICFLATLTKFWPSSSHKMTENGGFWPLSGKVFMQSSSYLVCTHWVSVMNWFDFRPSWPNSGRLVAL